MHDDDKVNNYYNNEYHPLPLLIFTLTPSILPNYFLYTTYFYVSKTYPQINTFTTLKMRKLTLWAQWDERHAHVYNIDIHTLTIITSNIDLIIQDITLISIILITTIMYVSQMVDDSKLIKVQILQQGLCKATVSQQPSILTISRLRSWNRGSKYDVDSQILSSCHVFWNFREQWPEWRFPKTLRVSNLKQLSFRQTLNLDK